jgi:hypothetical protein
MVRAVPDNPSVLVCGSARSGTTTTAGLIGAHSRYERILPELRLHVDRHGLLDVASGQTTPARFYRYLTHKWFDRNEERPRGIFAVLDFESVEAIGRRYLETCRDDPLAAGAVLIGEIIAPVLAAAGKPGWVEHSPNNALHAARLHEMLPEARFVHPVRDGRDAALSISRMPWGPSDPFEALRLWGHRVRRAYEQLSHVPDHLVHTFAFEDLVVHDREGTLAALLGFLEEEDEPGVREFFGRLRAARAHPGRWRTEVPAERLDEFARVYAGIVAGLDAAGIRLPGSHGEEVPEAEGLAEPIGEQQTYELHADLTEAAMRLETTARLLRAQSAERDRLQRQRDEAREVADRHRAAATRYREALEGKWWFRAARALRRRRR